MERMSISKSPVIFLPSTRTSPVDNRRGLIPEDIDIVIHTHLHNDHCENDYKCSNAAIFVHEKELAAIHYSHPLDFRYLIDYIEDVEENGQINVVSEDTEILPGIKPRKYKSGARRHRFDHPLHW